MDELLAQAGVGGDATIGLNIVCDAPPLPARDSSGNKRRKKNNKYERRRARARKARKAREDGQRRGIGRGIDGIGGGGARQGQGQQKKASVDSGKGGKEGGGGAAAGADIVGGGGGGGADGTSDNHSDNIDYPPRRSGGRRRQQAADMDGNNSAMDEAVVSDKDDDDDNDDGSDGEDGADAERPAANDDSGTDTNSSSEAAASDADDQEDAEEADDSSDSDDEGSSDDDASCDGDDGDDDDGPTPLPSPQKLSRRVHDAALLEDERKRAEYMATFHARPHEIDRRSGAARSAVGGGGGGGSGRIKPSRESNHIFVDEDDDGDEEMDTSSNQDDVGADDNVREEAEEEDEKVPLQPPSCPFEAIGLHPRLAKAVTSDRGPFGYNRPTIIQTNAVGALLPSTKSNKTNKSKAESSRSSKSSNSNKSNLFVQSETGSGKTLAYLLPIVQSLAVNAETNELKKVDRQVGGTRCIILCPTRELASQTATMAEKLCLKSFNWLVSGCLSGGEKRKSEKARLRKGVSILIATPGRLLDHITKTDCLLMSLKGKLEWLVLDEADRLLDMGLGGQVEEIVQHIRANQPRSGIKRDGITWRSCLVSATVTPKIEELAKKTLGGDAWVWARAKKSKGGDLDDELGSSAPRQLAQLHLTCSAKLRLPTLVAFLTARVQKGEKLVVFMSTCDGVEFYHSLFSKMSCILPRNDDDSESERQGIFGSDCSLYRLHGNVQHAERHTILKQFGSTSKRASILFATDVAARGLNLPGVDWILQFDPPSETSDYVHRAGRVARAGKAGHALLFLLPSEKQFIEVLELRGMKDMSALSLSSTLNGAANICKELSAEGVKRSGGGYGSGGGSREGEAFAQAIQARLEECIMDDESAYKDELRKSLEQKKTKGANKIMKHAIGELHEAAIKAYSAHIRSYPAKEKAVRHIFSPRALHLGHVARSFALREQPKSLSGKRRALDGGDADEEAEDILKSTGKKRNSRLAFGKNRLGGNEGDGGADYNDRKDPPKGNKRKKKSSADKADLAVLESITGKKSKARKLKASEFGGDKRSAGDNQKRMMAMAQKMSHGMSEFF